MELNCVCVFIDVTVKLTFGTFECKMTQPSYLLSLWLREM